MSETKITLDGETFERIRGAWFDLAEDAPRSPLPSSSVFVHALDALAAARAQVESMRDVAGRVLHSDTEVAKLRRTIETLQADLAAVRTVEEWIKSNATRRVLVDSLGNVGAFVVGDAKVAAGIDIPALGRALAALEGANG